VKTFPIEHLYLVDTLQGHAPGMRRARRLAAALAEVSGVTVAPVDTNIVHVTVAGKAAQVAELAEQRGVRIAAMGPDLLRMCTHRDVSGPDFDQCLAAVVEAHRQALGK